MSFTSLVIWLENAESFMKAVIRVIYRITPSYSQLHKSLLCNAGAAQVNREQKHPLHQNHPLVYLSQFANGHGFFVITTWKTADSMARKTWSLCAAAWR